MKHYLCLMRRWKPSRVYHHLALNHHNILDKGSVSAILAKWDVKSIFKDIDRTKLEMNNAGEVTFSDCATEDDTEFNRTLLKQDDVLDIVTEEFFQRMRPDLSMLGTSSETYKIRAKENIKSLHKSSEKLGAIEFKVIPTIGIQSCIKIHSFLLFMKLGLYHQT